MPYKAYDQYQAGDLLWYEESHAVLSQWTSHQSGDLQTLRHDISPRSGNITRSKDIMEVVTHGDT